jgi:hypothetical protein
MNREEKLDDIYNDGWLTAKGRGTLKPQVIFDVFNIPVEKLFPLEEIVSSINQDQATTIENETSLKNAPLEFVMGTKFTCRVCGVEFSNLREQQCHFKTSLHVVNLKRSLVGLDSVSSHEEDDSDEDDEAEGGECIFEPEVWESEEYSGRLSFENTSFPDGQVRKCNHKTNGSVTVFRKHNSNWEFSISNSIYGMSFNEGGGRGGEETRREEGQREDPWRSLKNALQIFHLGDKLHSCVLVLQSGMFAGAVFEGRKCVLHKVLRRYTVRAKAGGGQSSFDSNGRKAKSAGATLRRYGEQALKEDIQALLLSWLPYLQSSVVILTAIPKTMKHYIFSDSLQAGFSRDDARIRAIPFMVKKPTFEEIKLVHHKCMLIEFNIVSVGGVDVVSPDAEYAMHTVEEETSERCRAEEEGEREEASSGGAVDEMSPLEAVVPEEMCDSLRELMAQVVDGNTEGFDAALRSITASAAQLPAGAAALWLSAPHSLDRLETPLHVAAEGTA